MIPTDVALHARFGIDADLLRDAQIARVDDLEARSTLSANGTAGDFAGLVYPYLDPRTSQRVTCRVRLDHPPLKADGKPDGKYRAPYGDRRHLYFAPGLVARLTDPSVPVVMVESEKAALAVTAAARRGQRPILAIATGGCWGWQGRVGKADDPSGVRVDVKGPLDDFAIVQWTGRLTIILFDARPNESVTAARRALARELRGRGADVRHGHLPDDARVNGPDDLIAASGDAALWAILDGARLEDFSRDTNNRIVADSLDNLRLALAQLNIRLTYDAFARVVLLNDTPLDDLAIDRLIVAIDDRFHFRALRQTLLTLALADGHQAAIHPVREYLARLVWDGTPRLDTWLSAYGGAEDTPYIRAAGSLALLAAVRRVRSPGCKFDELLILESAQGTLKSSALRALCPDERWFSDDLPLGVDSKLVIERTAGKWLIEASELHGNRGREAEQLKAFLSRQTDGPVRLAYGRLPTTVPRQFVIIGTTNSRLAYLKDSTGARRFWPVTVQRFDVSALEADRDQIWAEAAAREAAGASIRLASDLWDAASTEQEDRRAVDPWEAILEPLLEGDGIVRVDHVLADDIWKALKLEANQLDNRHADRVAAILQRHGYQKARRRFDGGPPVRGWVRA